MSVQQENITAAMAPCATTLVVHITALVRRDMLEMDETAQARIYTISAVRWRIILPYHL